MNRKTRAVLWSTLLVVVLNACSSAQETQTVFDYLGSRAARLAADLPPIPDTLEDWKLHKGALVAHLKTTLGLPDRELMKSAVIDQHTDGDLIIQEIAYLWAADTFVSATVIRSGAAQGPRPTVVIPSGWLGHPTRQAYREFIETLAHNGFIVLFIDDPRIGRRHAPHAGLYAAAAAAGTPVAGIQVFDVLRGLDYLLTRDDVDAGRIGTVGLGQGSMQAYLAAALEPRIQFVVAVGGATTYQALARDATTESVGLAPSAYVAEILNVTDMDRVAACIAPRPVLMAGNAGGAWPVRGNMQVLRTMKAVYGLYDATDRIHRVSGEQTDDLTPYITEIAGWLDTTLATLPDIARDAVDPPVDNVVEAHQFSMLRCMQQRIADQASALPLGPESGTSTSKTAWQAYRMATIDWLRSQCDLDRLLPGPDRVVEQEADDVLITEQLALGVDADFSCPAVLIRPASSTVDKFGAVVISHDDRQCAASPKIASAAAQLATAGYWVIVPDHASVHPQSRQHLGDTEYPSFLGDEAARLYGPADVVGLPPLALRVIENLAAVRYLATRSELDSQHIVIVGMGVGAIDASLAAVLENRIAGVAAIDVTTMRDWASSVAPNEINFFHVMPYLPAALKESDFDLLLATIAPRPLLVARLKDGWPRSGFDQCVSTAGAIYGLQQAADAFLALGPRDATEDLQASSPDGVQRQLVAVARTLLPAPPQPGLVGNVQGLCARRSVDSAAGLIWIVAELDGYDQELVDGGYRLRTWSFFNDNGGAQKGHVATPLILKLDGDQYELIGIGTARPNAGTGLQTFDFELVDGTDAVSEGCFFGWHTGQADGKRNPGVIEYDSATDCQMVILTADGQMTGQPLKIGGTYRVQSKYPRRYSVMAVSQRE